jgi:hypothetical protein
VLESLARFGINVNWILTGEGHLLRGGSASHWSAMSEEIRGNLTIPEFVIQMDLRNPDNVIETIQAIEYRR